MLPIVYPYSNNCCSNCFLGTDNFPVTAICPLIDTLEKSILSRIKLRRVNFQRFSLIESAFASPI